MELDLRSTWPATVQPRLLAGPCGLLDADGAVPAAVAGLTRSIGVRDAAVAAALAVAPPGRSLRLLTAARVLSDGADAVWLGRLAAPGKRRRVASVAAGWALLELLTGLAGRR